MIDEMSNKYSNIIIPHNLTYYIIHSDDKSLDKSYRIQVCIIVASLILVEWYYKYIW